MLEVSISFATPPADETRFPAAPQSEQKTVLHVGCGRASPHKLHSFFRGGQWREIRVDIDRQVLPDIVADISDLSAFRDGCVDAIWSSHSLEHIHDHQVPVALREFRRILKDDGLILVTMPDLESVAQLIVDGKAEDVAYQSPAGPITALDMVFGHRRSIENGNPFMAHKTGFTQHRLRRLLTEAGFARSMILRGRSLDLWAVGLMPGASRLLLTAPFR